ncbi:phage tail protein [Citrobacter freundii]|uniref:Phage tail protein n=2 Tax=Citrobacter freundii TaxID=546 RepID=A0AAP9QAZ1_CITFR|nr:phage tail protein [Citrobacter freundii]QLV29641.1 phage tail protein [Citrobacter freundii]
MSAGVIQLTHNSATVLGYQTSFSTTLQPGDFVVSVVGGIAYTLPVKSIESNDSLTLVSAFTGPTANNLAWDAVSRVALNMVTAAMVVQNTEALRGLNYDKQNWQLIFSSSGDVTVKLPDGSSFTGPAWGGIAATLSGLAKKGANSDITSLTGLTTPLSLTQGGTGAKDAAGGRQALELKSAATRDADDSLKNYQSGEKLVAMQAVTDFRLISAYDSMENYPKGVSGGLTKGSSLPQSGFGATEAVGLINNRGWHDQSGADTSFQIACKGINIGFRGAAMAGGAWYFSRFYKLRTEANTTVDSNGFIKQASPIVNIFGSGKYTTNEESEGVTVIRTAKGEYLINGCIGLSSDAAWGGIDGGFEIPVDRNKQPRIWLDYKVNADGSVLVRTYHRVHSSAPPFAQNRIGNTDIDGVFTETVADGEPVDIPADSFVSVRVEMPEDSIWNRMQKETREAIEKAERERQQNQQDTQS